MSGPKAALGAAMSPDVAEGRGDGAGSRRKRTLAVATAGSFQMLIVANHAPRGCNRTHTHMHTHILSLSQSYCKTKGESMEISELEWGRGVGGAREWRGRRLGLQDP